MTETHFFTTFGNDLEAFTASIIVLLLYHGFLAYRVKRDPGYTVQSVNAIARTAWVHSIMHDGVRDVLPVQTLRNSTIWPPPFSPRLQC